MNRQISLPHTGHATFTIPFPGESTSYVSVGDEITYGQKLFEVRRKRILSSYFLPDLLNIKPNKADEYIGRIEGEYVEEGDLLAEKLTAAGMLGKRVVATVDGVIGMDRISLGYLDILGEEEVFTVNSSVKGRVAGITLNSHMVVESEVGRIDYRYGNSLSNAIDIEDGYIVGEFTLVEDGRSVYTEKSLKQSYDGEVVYAGRFVYASLVNELLRRGARCVVTYAVDYDELANIDAPLVVLGGFGQLPVNKDMQALLQGSVGHLVKIDINRPYMYFSNKKGLDPKKYKGRMYFAAQLAVGDRVISNATDSYGVVGEITEIFREDDGNKCLINVTDGANLIIDMRLLDSYTIYEQAV